MTRRLLLAFFAVTLAVAATGTLHAVGGCDDSPEAPTDILLVIGSAGMVLGSPILAAALRRRRNR